MTRTILKAVTGGLIVGTMAFFMPKLLIGLLILGFVFGAIRCLGYSRCCSRHHRDHHLFYLADKIRKMSDEEYESFRTRMGAYSCDHGYHHHAHCCGNNKAEGNDCCADKKEVKSEK